MKTYDTAKALWDGYMYNSLNENKNLHVFSVRN